MPPIRCGIGYYLNRLLDYTTHPFRVLTTSGTDIHTRADATYYVPSWKIRDLPELIRTAKKDHPSIIHIQYPALGYGRQLGINFLPYCLRLFTRSKIIITLHEFHASRFIGKTRNLITTLPCHRVIVSNTRDQAALPWILRRKSSIIPIGSNIPLAPRNRQYFNTLLARAGFSKSSKTAVFFGFAFAAKGIETALEAAYKSGTQLLLLSELDENNPYHKKLIAKIDILKAQGARIFATGYLSDQEVSEVLQECDYFLLPQPLPLTAKSGTAIAAAVHGLIIVSTADSDPKMNLPYRNKDNAVLLKRVGPLTLAKALTGLQVDPELESTIKKHAKELSQYFSWEGIAEEHELLYKGMQQ